MPHDQGTDKLSQAFSAVRDRAAPLLMMGAIVVAYFAYIGRFGVNVPFWDEWELVAVFQKFYRGKLGILDLITVRHNEHLMCVPFALMLVQSVITGFNSKSFLFTSAALQVAALILVIRVVWPMLPAGRNRLWFVLPIVVLMFSLSPQKNILWGFQTAWYLITFFLICSLVLLDKALGETATARQVGEVLIAAGLACLASFSSFHGLFVWVAGLAFILFKKNLRLKEMVRDVAVRAWVIPGLVTLVLFLVIYLNAPHGRSLFRVGILNHPGLPAYISVVSLGSVMGDVSDRVAFFSGVFLLLLLGGAAWKVACSPRRSAYAFPLALIVFGAIFVASMSLGRSSLGAAAGREARYTTYTLLALVGMYLIYFHNDENQSKRGLLFVGRSLFMTYVAVLAVASTYFGLVRGQQWKIEQAIGAMILREYQSAPDFQLERMLYGNATFVRRNADFLRTHSLSVFAARGIYGCARGADIRGASAVVCLRDGAPS